VLRITRLRVAPLLLGFLLVLLASQATGPALAAGTGAGHGEEAHPLFTEDQDLDGVPNWRDPNSDVYVCGEIGYHTFNFALFFGVIAYMARRPLLDTFRERALDIRKGLTESARERDEAHQRHQELVARLSSIEKEVEEMHEKAKVEAAQEEASLERRAEEAAQRIAAQAERTIADEARRARQALRKEAVDLAVQLAETTLTSKVASRDQQKLAEQFLASLKGANDGQ